MKKLYFLLFCSLIMSALHSQTFTDQSSILPSAKNSGGCTGVTDMNNDGLDDIIILDQSKNLNIAYQQVDGSFLNSSFGTVSNSKQWGMCIGDVDNDGHKDVMSGGSYDQVHIVNINGPDNFTQANYSWANIFMQGCNLADIDNDGWLDGFACHDDGHNKILHNDGTGTMTDGTSMMDMVFYPETNGNDNSGNYGSVWTDFDLDGDLDLFIAKCRQFIDDPYDPRRTNILMVNDGNNNFTEEAFQRGLVNLQQSWTSDFADMDNDGDFDVLLTTHSNTLEIYANDGTGYFTNVTSGSGLEYSGFFLQAKMVDFDNDGFVDLVHSGGSHRYFHNDGDMTFTLVEDVFVSADVMHSFGIGDLNHDGFLDLYASYGNSYVDADNQYPDKVFINNSNENHFIVFDLEGTISNMDAAGAVVKLYGPWGVQLREVRDGESYGITNSSMCYFGIGSETEIEYAEINWPSGIVTTITNPSIDTWYSVIEDVCFIAAPTISALSSTVICPADEVTIQVNDAGNATFEWSTGETTSSINVSEAGSYFVTASNGDECEAISQSITVSYFPEETPSIVAAGDLHICDNTSVILTASQSTEYNWSTGETSQSITVSDAGDYTVQVPGICAWQVSPSITVETTPAPAAPSVLDISVNPGETATFEVTGGTSVQWYDTANGTTPIATGSTFTTPALSADASYWVEDVITYGGDEFNGGKEVWTENNDGQYQNNSTYYLLFDALNDVYINTVKVYASGAGNRTIAVIDASNNTIATGTFDIPDGESVVTLDFFVPAGTGYGIRSVGNNPQLWRDKDLDTPFDFPFNIGNLVSITNTSVANADTYNYYYYFYEWQVSSPDFTCVSDRVEVQAIIISVENLETVNQLNVYPNPASEELNISFNGSESDMMMINLIDQTGRVVLANQKNFATGSNNHRMDLSDVATGLYQIQFIVDGKFTSRKIVVE